VGHGRLTAGVQGPRKDTLFYPITTRFFTPGSIILDHKRDDSSDFQNYISSILDNYLGFSVPASVTTVTGETFANGSTVDLSKRQASASALVTVTFTFINSSVGTPQQLAATLLVATASLTTMPSLDGVVPQKPLLAPTSAPLLATPLKPSASTVTAATTGAPVVGTTSGKSSSNVHISKGALAGIIIGCILGCVIVVTMLYLVIRRRQEASPMAFRAPAAAYRP